MVKGYRICGQFGVLMVMGEVCKDVTGKSELGLEDGHCQGEMADEAMRSLGHQVC